MPENPTKSAVAAPGGPASRRCDTNCDTSCDTTRRAQRAASARCRASGHAARIPHIQRRGRIWQYRRRCPTHLVRRGLRPIFLVSLRTELLSAAAGRAHLLDAALEELLAWAEEMFDSVTRPVTAETIDLVVGEVFNQRARRIVRDHVHGGPRTAEEADAALARARSELAEIDRAARLRDFSAADAPVEEAMDLLGLCRPCDDAVDAPLKAAAFGKLKSLATLQHALEEEGCLDAAAEAARVPRASLDAVGAAEPARRVDLETAFETAVRYAASDDMRNHIRSAARIAIETLGGKTPIDAVGPEQMIEVLLFARRLPADHGRKHGINRYTKDKQAAREAQPSKAEQIEQADAYDREVRDAASRMDEPDHVKLAFVAENLTRRVNEKTIKKIHAHMMHAFKAARDHLAWKGEVPAPVMSQYRQRAKAAADREQAEGGALATRRRIRRSWADERIQTLLTSPIYTGSASSKRRYKPGKMIVRDSCYWAPLIMPLMGLRPSEILQLQKSDMICRDGVFAIDLNTKGGKRLKTESSERIVPIHRSLLALGFVDWVNAERAKPGRFLFPEIMHDVAADDSPSRRFGERFDPVRRNLGVASEEEDLYALRRTFGTMLANAGVGDADRAALMGHAQLGITNIHYTDRELKRLQGEIDKVDLRLSIEFDHERGFPVISGCDIVDRPSVAIDLRADANGNPVEVTLYEDASVGAVAYKARIKPMASCGAAETCSDPGTAAPSEVSTEVRARLNGRRAKVLDRRLEPVFELLMSC